MLSINSDVNSIKLNYTLANATSAINTAMERMSTGYRINSAKDDAAGMAVSNGLNVQIRANQQAQKNTQDGLSFLGVASGALTGMTSMLQRMRDLALQSANGTYGEDARNAVDKEAQALTKELYRQKNTTNFNGVDVFGGDEKTGRLINDVTKLTETQALAESYVAIKTAEEFVTEINKNKSGKFILMNDIDFSGVDYKAITGFSGELNGNGYAIKNVTINSTVANQGLFADIKDGRVQNLTLEKFDIKNRGAFTGSLAGMIDRTTVTNVAVIDSKVSGAYYTGGLIGRISESSIVSSSYAIVNVIGTVGVGGLFGAMGSNAESINNYSLGTIKGDSRVGGIAGDARAFKITSNYSTSNVTGADAVGGLVGYMQNGTIRSSYANGSVSGTSNAGGLMGLSANQYIQNKIYDCFWDTQETSKIKGIGGDEGRIDDIKNLIGLTTAQMKDPTNFINVGWSADVWDFEAGRAPLLKVVGPIPPPPVDNIRLQVGTDGSDNSAITFDSTVKLDGFKIDLTSKEKALESLKKIDELMSKLVDKNTEFGAITNRLQSVLEMQSIAIINLSAANSSIKDADIAQESAKFIRAQILQNASATLLSQSAGLNSSTSLNLIINSRLK